MFKILVWLAIIGLIAVFVIGVVAPATPDGSWLNDFGESVRDALSAFWGSPVTAK